MSTAYYTLPHIKFLVVILMFVLINFIGCSSKTKIPVIFDTDIGDDIDDAFALVMALQSPELDIRGICVNTGRVELRAKMVAKLLKIAGYTSIPVYLGEIGPEQGEAAPQMGWVENYEPDITLKQGAVDFIIASVKDNPNKISILSYGPLSTMGAVFSKAPDMVPLVKDLIIMGGAVYIGYNNNPPPVPEYNIKHDTPASQIVFLSGVKLTMLGLDVTTMMQPTTDQMLSLGTARTILANPLLVLYLRWAKFFDFPHDAAPRNVGDLIKAHYGEGKRMKMPTLYDPVAVLTAIDSSDIVFEKLNLRVDDGGMTVIDNEKGKPVLAGVKVNKEAVLKKIFGMLVNR